MVSLATFGAAVAAATAPAAAADFAGFGTMMPKNGLANCALTPPISA